MVMSQGAANTCLQASMSCLTLYSGITILDPPYPLRTPPNIPIKRVLFAMDGSKRNALQ